MGDKPTKCLDCVGGMFDYCAEVEPNEDNVKALCFGVNNSYMLDLYDLNKLHPNCPFYMSKTEKMISELCENHWAKWYLND